MSTDTTSCVHGNSGDCLDCAVEWSTRRPPYQDAHEGEAQFTEDASAAAPPDHDDVRAIRAVVQELAENGIHGGHRPPSREQWETVLTLATAAHMDRHDIPHDSIARCLGCDVDAVARLVSVGAKYGSPISIALDAVSAASWNCNRIEQRARAAVKNPAGVPAREVVVEAACRAWWLFESDGQPWEVADVPASADGPAQIAGHSARRTRDDIRKHVRQLLAEGLPTQDGKGGTVAPSFGDRVVIEVGQELWKLSGTLRDGGTL